MYKKKRIKDQHFFNSIKFNNHERNADEYDSITVYTVKTAKTWLEIDICNDIAVELLDSWNERYKGECWSFTSSQGGRSS